MGALAAVAALAVRGLPSASLRAATATGEPVSEPTGLVAAIGEASAQVAQLRAQVDAGTVIPNFGDKAQEVVAAAMTRAGSYASEDLERALDGALEGLFLQQAVLLREKVAAMFGAPEKRQVDAVEQAEQQFLAEGKELIRPGSAWSLGPPAQALRTELQGNFLRQAALDEERARAAQIQRTTIGVISRLQEQMDQLQQKVQGVRSGGSPWVLSSSYRIPKTPLQISGRYEQGRANIELNLTPDKDPSNSEASFAEGIGPANLGVSFNLGI